MARSVKFVYQGMLRRLGVETLREPSGRVTIAGLQGHAQSLFPALQTCGDGRNIAFTYADEAGDVCTVTTDAELEEAFRVVKDLELAVLRLDVVPMESPLTGDGALPEELKEGEARAVHPNIICDGCEMAPLRGPRFQCTVRADYDLCQACEAKDASGFNLIKIKDPAQAQISTGQGNCITGGGGGNKNGGEQGKGAPALGMGGEMAENPWPVVAALAQRVRLEGAASVREFGPFLAWRKPNGTLVLQHPAPGASAASSGRAGPCWKAGGCVRVGPKGCVDFHGCGGPFASFHVEKLPPAGGGGGHGRSGGWVRLLTANRKWRLAAMGGKLVGVPALELGQHTVFIMHPDEEAPTNGCSSQGEMWADNSDKAEGSSGASGADQETPEWQALQAVAEADAAAEALAQATKAKATQQASRAAEEPPQAPTAPSAKAADVAPLQACFLADVTVPDGTVVAPGESFRKVWRLRNDGDVPLPEARLVWCGGAYGGPSQGGPTWGVPVPPVPPCAEFEVGVWLTAPEQVPGKTAAGNGGRGGGLVRSYWRLEGVDSGRGFGHRLWAEVRVVEPEASSLPTTTTAKTSEASAAAPASKAAAAAAAAEPEGQVCTFPVELSEGGRLTISWRRGEAPETVGLRFLTAHGLSVDQVPDVAAFVRRAEASLPPVVVPPVAAADATTATTDKNKNENKDSAPVATSQAGGAASVPSDGAAELTKVEQIAQKRAELKAEKRAAIAAQAFDRVNAIKGQLSVLNAEAASVIAPPPPSSSSAAEEEEEHQAPTQGRNEAAAGAAAAVTRVVTFKELAPHSTQAREFLKPVPGCGAVARAWYGNPKHPWSHKHGKDVTDKVTQLVASNPPYGPACNARLGGDPARGVRKMLFVEFFLLEETRKAADGAASTSAAPVAAPAEAAAPAVAASEPAPAVAAVAEQAEATAAAAAATSTETAAAAAAAAPSSLAVHPRVTCDRSGMSPLVGGSDSALARLQALEEENNWLVAQDVYSMSEAEAEAHIIRKSVVQAEYDALLMPLVGVRYSVPGADYDLCEAEFDKLEAIERPLHVATADPGAEPVPCGLVAECAEAPKSVDNVPAAAAVEPASAEPALVAEAAGAGKAAGEDGFVESEVGRLEGRPATTVEANQEEKEAQLAASVAGEVVPDDEEAPTNAQDNDDEKEGAGEQERAEELARWQAQADADAAAVVRAVAVADAAVAEAVAQSWGGSQEPSPASSDGPASATFSMPGSDDEEDGEGEGSAGWEHVEACSSEEAEDGVAVEEQEGALPNTEPTVDAAALSVEVNANNAVPTECETPAAAAAAAPKANEDEVVVEQENELEASFEGAALAGSQLQAASNDDLTESVSMQLADAASNEAFGARLAKWSEPVGKVMELGFDDVSAILDALERRCATPQDYDGRRAQQVVNDLLGNMPSVQ